MNSDFLNRFLPWAVNSCYLSTYLKKKKNSFILEIVVLVYNNKIIAASIILLNQHFFSVHVIAFLLFFSTINENIQILYKEIGYMKEKFY